MARGCMRSVTLTFENAIEPNIIPTSCEETLAILDVIFTACIIHSPSRVRLASRCRFSDYRLGPSKKSLIHDYTSIDMLGKVGIVRYEYHRPRLVFGAEPAKKNLACSGQHVVEGAIEDQQ